MADTAVTETQSAAWWDLVARFKAAAQQVDQVLNTLRTQEGAARSDPALSGQYDAIMGRAAALRQTIGDYLSKIDTAVQWVKGAGQWVADAVGLNGLGFVPVLIGIGAITAALATVTAFLSDAWALSKRIEEQHRLEARGLSPQEAAQVVDRSTAASAGSSWIKQLAAVLGVAALGWLALRASQQTKGQ
ncbi:MAG: hypothetical protein RL268_492 [Pseudomonadota bacterium]|jgi:hypothetical protein